MNLSQKIILFFFFLFTLQLSSVASVDKFNITLDTIPKTFNGKHEFNLQVKSIKVIKRKGKTVKIEYNLANKGVKRIKLGKGNLDNLIVQFDKSLEENDLTDSKKLIIEHIKYQNLSLRPGQLVMGNKLKFKALDIPPSDRIADVEENIEENSTVVTEVETPMIEKEVEQVVEVTEDTTPMIKEEVEQVVEVTENTTPMIKEEVEQVVEVTENTTPIIKEEVEQVVEVNENTTPIIKEEVEQVVEVNKNTTTIIEEEVEQVVEVTENTTTIIEEEVEQIVEVNETNSPTEEMVKENSSLNLERQCSDLKFEDIKVLKKNNRFVLIEYSVTNIGNAPVNMYGDSKRELDNIGLQVHLNRSKKLTRGSIPVKAAYIKKGISGKRGTLYPNETFTSKLKIELSKLTKFTPVLSITIDPLQQAQECNETNNLIFVNIMEDKAPQSDNVIPNQEMDIEVKNIEKIVDSNN